MRLPTDGDGFIDIDAGYDGSDFTVSVSVAFDGFAGRTNTWVRVTTWRDFIAKLVALEAAGTGSATLSSPEMSVTVRSTELPRRMADEGFVATYDPLPPTRLAFAARTFDASELARVVRELRGLS